MNFGNVKSLRIPQGSVYQILSGSTVLWTKSGETPPEPTVKLPPSNQIWYEATAQISSLIGNPTSHTFDSTTGRGVLTYADDIVRSWVVGGTTGYSAFRGNVTLTKIWWPASCMSWNNDCMHSCPALQEIYAGSSLQNISDGTCNNGTTPRKIVLVDNDYFYENETGLVLKSNNTLLLGTYNLDIRDTPCTALGSRCMADMELNGATLYFPSTMTTAYGDWYIGSSNKTAAYTIYLPCTTAPNWDKTYIRGAITWHIPAVNSGYESWKTWTSSGNWTFIEDL